MITKAKNTFTNKKMLGRAVKYSFLKIATRTQAQKHLIVLVYL